MGIYDGFFEVKKETDGMYIYLYPPGPGGEVIKVAEIFDELKKLGCFNYNTEEIRSALIDLIEEKKIKIVINSDRQSNSEESVENDKLIVVTVSDDGMQVFATFYPTDHNELSKSLIMREIKKQGIVTPVDEDYIDNLLNNFEYNVPYEICTGKRPIDGTPNTIKYHFKTKDNLKPEIDEDGNVNFHKLNLVANVNEGQLLAELITGDNPVDGVNVFGKTVNAKKPKIIKMSYGKNTKLSDDKKSLYASKAGLVKLEGIKIAVYEVYEVANNVGVSTGDIEFNGTVIVYGNVASGFTVKASGDVEVMGAIENASIEAGGSVIAHRGIQGGSHCVVHAKGDINSKYIENSVVNAGGEIHSEAILHSKVSASGEIFVEGKKGLISGGIVRSGIKISATTLGSHMATATSIEVGIDPIVWEEYNEIKKNLPKMKNELIKLDQIINLLNKKKEVEGQLDDKKQEMYISATRNKIFLANKINLSAKKFEEYKELVEARNDGKVIVRGTMYSGVKVTISTAKYFVRDAIQYVELIKVGADIQLNAL